MPTSLVAAAHMATLALLALPTLAQQATITVSAPFAVAINDPFTIDVTLAWQGAPQFAHIAGSLVIEQNAGWGSDFTSDFPAGPLAQHGTFVGGSRQNMDFASTPAFFTGGFFSPPSGNASGIVLARYTVRIDFPDFYVIRWVPSPIQPLVGLYPSTQSPAMVRVTPTLFADRVWVGGCCFPTPCVPDLTRHAVPGSPGYGIPNGVVDNEDFFYFLAHFAAGNAGVCDLTHTATPGSPGYGINNFIIDNEDFFYYLDFFSQGC